MNERIKELWVEGTQTSIPREGDYSSVSAKNIEKFAELIIRECVDIVNKRKDAAIDADWLVDEAMSNAVWDIEEHFGVENDTN